MYEFTKSTIMIDEVSSCMWVNCDGFNGEVCLVGIISFSTFMVVQHQDEKLEA
jgi:hypothetical protein